MKSYAALSIGVLSISFAAIFIRLAEAPPLVIAAYRMSIASIILIPITSIKYASSFKRLPRNDIVLILFSSISIALHFGLWISSLSYTSIASSVVLVTSHPVFVALISYFLWGERLRKLTIIGIVVALTGVMFINYSGFTISSRAIFGDLLALIASLAMGVYLIIGRQLKDSIDITSYLTIIYTSSAAILLVATIVFGHSFIGYSHQTYLMLVLIALIPQLIGHSCLNFAVRSMPVTVVSVAILGEPIGATLLGFIILDEIPTVNEIVGGFLILSGIFTVIRRKPEHWAIE